MRILSILAVLSLLAGCNLESLYTIKKLNELYCSEANENNRERIIEIIRKRKPDYPEGGLCGIEHVIADKIG